MVHPSLTHPVTHLIMEHKAHFIFMVSVAISLLFGFGYYNKEMCFYPQVFFFPQPLLILSRLPATPSPLCFFSQPPFDSVILCLGRLLCLCTLSTAGFWKTAVPCLPLASNAEARALPREGDQVWLCRHAHGGHKGAGRVMLRSVSSVWGRLL